ncbi:structural maintenance of chromosomes protein 3-like [Contarinia nasturtii]|uniref:structural maintenance of chromosomes protein 3-like n=1 Tax=Contarinia nasturtii TaxID=265458 RepID=UPI0012D385B9|nr:structural maintenance of chromosomes protein 3-like [Contarinia nasturtii]
MADKIAENVGDAVGVDIFARFDEIEESFNNLFGQKRRLVALLYIISMQQLLPAPFYLFDSIEELIFEPYLEPLITYLNELSNTSQIIASTRRRGLVNGPNFIDDIFRMTEGVPHGDAEMVSYQED